MATGKNNNKSSRKDMRFPNELIERIEEQAKKENVTFSAWVKNVCTKHLDDIAQNKK